MSGKALSDSLIRRAAPMPPARVPEARSFRSASSSGKHAHFRSASSSGATKKTEKMKKKKKKTGGLVETEEKEGYY